MLVEITNVEVEGKAIIVTAENLENICNIENLDAEIETEIVTYKFEGQFELSTLEKATRKIYQCASGRTFRERLEKMVGARTILLPDKYIVH